MKLLITLSLLLTLILGCVDQALAQTKGRKTQSGSTAVCSIEGVSKGMVVVGYKHNATCKAGKELTVKNAENGDIVCAGSPIPAGFSVFAEAQGPMIGSCPNRAFLINDEMVPARTSELNPAALDAKCKSEVDKSIASSVKNNLRESLAVWLAQATETICMNSGGREH